jgi:hypothetical protein
MDGAVCWPKLVKISNSPCRPSSFRAIGFQWDFGETEKTSFHGTGGGFAAPRAGIFQTGNYWKRLWIKPTVYLILAEIRDAAYRGALLPNNCGIIKHVIIIITE